MAIEIEHKYLVNYDQWQQVIPVKSVPMKQGYLVNEAKHVVRIRTAGSKGYLTVKGSSRGNARPEFEYEIPLEDALQMLQLFCRSLIEKTRHYVNVTNNIWEVDVFEGANTGLIVAEIELQSDDETYTVPPWAGLNVSSDHRYANVQLAATPYSSWPVSERTTL